MGLSLGGIISEITALLMSLDFISKSSKVLVNLQLINCDLLDGKIKLGLGHMDGKIRAANIPWAIVTYFTHLIHK